MLSYTNVQTEYQSRAKKLLSSADKDSYIANAQELFKLGEEIAASKVLFPLDKMRYYFLLLEDYNQLPADSETRETYKALSISFRAACPPASQALITSKIKEAKESSLSKELAALKM